MAAVPTPMVIGTILLSINNGPAVNVVSFTADLPLGMSIDEAGTVLVTPDTSHLSAVIAAVKTAVETAISSMEIPGQTAVDAIPGPDETDTAAAAAANEEA